MTQLRLLLLKTDPLERVALFPDGDPFPAQIGQIFRQWRTARMLPDAASIIACCPSHSRGQSLRCLAHHRQSVIAKHHRKRKGLDDVVQELLMREMPAVSDETVQRGLQVRVELPQAPPFRFRKIAFLFAAMK